MKTKEEILETYFAKEFLDDQSENGGFWMKSEILGAMQEYTDQFQPSEIMPSDSILDLKQYVTNLLYFAYTQGNTNVKTPTFDKWVEEMIDGIDGYFKSQLKPAEKEEKNAYNELLSASKAMLSNIEKWLETGDPADVETSEKLYDDLKKAVTDAQHVE